MATGDDTGARRAVSLAETLACLIYPGIKGVELACEVAIRHPAEAQGLPDVLAGMVRSGEIVEVEYVTPENESPDGARVKSFYLPKGTRVRVAAEAPGSF